MFQLGLIRPLLPECDVADCEISSTEGDMTMETLLRAQLFTQEGVGDIAAILDGKKDVSFVFAAERCHLCREFTPLLAMAYSSYAGYDVEVAFVSNDQHVEAFKAHYRMMPWLVVPQCQGYIRRDSV